MIRFFNFASCLRPVICCVFVTDSQNLAAGRADTLNAVPVGCVTVKQGAGMGRMVSASITSTSAAGLGTAGLLVIGRETAQPAAASRKHRQWPNFPQRLPYL